MKARYLALPIIIYEGKVQIKGKKRVNPLHPFILELAVRNHDLEEVITLFNIDKRLIQEAIVDLMTKEFVYVDLEKSLIYVSSEIEEAIDRGRLTEFLEDGYPETIILKWVQEIQSGQIMMLDDVSHYFSVPPSLRGKWIESTEKLQLNRKEYINIQNLSSHLLIKTAKMTLRTHISEGDIFERVNRVYSLNPVNSRYMYIPLKEKVIDNNKCFIPNSESIPISVIEAWTHSLTTLDAYAINDHSPADIEFLSQYHWQSLLSKWLDINQEIGPSFNSKLSKKDRKQKFIKIYRSLKNVAIGYLLPHMMDLGANIGQATVGLCKGLIILKKLEQAFNEAKDMIIIGSSFVNLSSLQKLQPLIEDAISRNVKIVLLWGLLGNEIQNIKDKLPILSNENVIFAKSREKFHSKFLIIDNIHAWITSCNLCSYQYTNTAPTESICELQYGPIIGELIEYAMEKIEHIKALSWIKQISDKDLEKHESVRNKEKILIEFQEIVSELIEKCDDVIKQPTNKEFLTEFKSVYEKEKELLKKIRRFETACLIENLENRRLLRAALIHAKHAIRIGTDRINRQAVGSVIITLINETLNKGIPIQVRWGRESMSSILRDDLLYVQKIIDNIVLETANKIEISKEPAQSHAKFLTMDKNLLLITSFNLLAFAGNGLADDDITDELGVVLSSQRIANEVIPSFSKPRAL